MPLKRHTTPGLFPPATSELLTRMSLPYRPLRGLEFMMTSVTVCPFLAPWTLKWNHAVYDVSYGVPAQSGPTQSRYSLASNTALTRLPESKRELNVNPPTSVSKLQFGPAPTKSSLDSICQAMEVN